MKKEKILSKFNLNMKDYNVELEEILDKKAFNVEAQNLLLSIFYKIENFYTDYRQVKREVPTRDKFIENLMQNIFKYCNKIEIIKPKGVKRQEKYLINLQDGIIQTFPNETVLIYALYKISEMRKIEGKALIDNAIVDILNEGNSLNYSEVIRDFNGWAWTSMIEDKQSLQYNLVYQNLLLVLGYERLSEIINISNKEQIVYKLQEYIKQDYDEQMADEFFKKFLKVCILLKCSKDEKYKSEILKEQKKIKEKLEVIENKPKFLSKVTNDKKELTNKIKEIDQILNDPDLLKKEYTNRNKNLEKNEKIFSISNLVEIMEEERNDLLKEIKEYNKLIDPREFVDMKKQIEMKNEFFNILELSEDKKEPIGQSILELQKQFLKCFKEKINKCILKKDMIDLIYEYRYYRFLKYKKDKAIREDRRLNKQNQEIVDAIIEKSEELKVLEKVSNNKEYNKLVIEEIFNIKAITLENVYIYASFEDGKMTIKYYDGNVLETKKDFAFGENDIKVKKKIKLFV